MSFLKLKICSSSLFFTAFCIKIRVSLCVFRVFSGETGTQFPDEPFKYFLRSILSVSVFFVRSVRSVKFASGHVSRFLFLFSVPLRNIKRRFVPIGIKFHLRENRQFEIFLVFMANTRSELEKFPI